MKTEYPVKTVYYTDEKNDEFSKAVITPKVIDGDYKYTDNSFSWKLKRFIAYRLVAFPIAYAYCKLALGHKIVNRKLLKGAGKGGCFLYGNHTQETGDAFIPSLVMCPKSVFVIVHPNNVSMPFLGRITPFLGALPLPSDIRAARNFKAAVEEKINEGACVTIYPEAHIWPYHVGIRNFPSESMRYPSELMVPSYAMTTVYKKRRFRKKPRAVTYVDGPFLPNGELPIRKRAADLRDRIYETMVMRSGESDCEYIRYVKKDDKETEE